MLIMPCRFVTLPACIKFEGPSILRQTKTRKLEVEWDGSISEATKIVTLLCDCGKMLLPSFVIIFGGTPRHIEWRPLPKGRLLIFSVLLTKCHHLNIRELHVPRETFNIIFTTSPTRQSSRNAPTNFSTPSSSGIHDYEKLKGSVVSGGFCNLHFQPSTRFENLSCTHRCSMLLKISFRCRVGGNCVYQKRKLQAS